MDINTAGIIAGVFLAAPFIVWGVFRFLDKIKQKFFSWSKYVVLSSFLILWSIAILVMVLALV